MPKLRQLKRLADLEKSAGGAWRVVVARESLKDRGMFTIDDKGAADAPLYTEAEVAEHLPAGNLHLVWVRYGAVKDM